MKTLTQPADATRRTTRPTLRRALALAVAPVIALAACSGEAPLTADPTTPVMTGSSTTSPTGTTTSTTSTEPTTAGTPQPQTTKTTPRVSITDPILGHRVTAVTLVRNMAWPAGHPVAAQNFEIIGVLVTVKAGARYSVGVSPTQLTLRLGNSFVTPTGEFGNSYGKLLATVPRDQTVTGMLVFKIDRGVHPITLQLRRPAYQVTTTDKAIPAAVFEAKLID